MRTSLANETPREAPYLTIEGVTAGYGGEPIISDVSAAVALGEVVSVLGPNGAGKSTLLKALVGVIHVEAGTVLLGSETVTNLRTDELARKGVGYVPQHDDVFDALTVTENLEMGGYLLPSSAVRSRMAEVIAVFPQLGTMLKRNAGNLSGGERKMLAVARVLMLEPKALILDEPTANLSPQLSLELLQNYVRRLANEGIAVLMVEQRASAALEVSDWAYVLVSGRTRLSGSAASLLAHEDFASVYLGRTSEAGNC